MATPPPTPAPTTPWTITAISIIALVLAAGSASRMGRFKQLLPWGAGTILDQTLQNVNASNVDGVVVVSGHRAPEVAAIARRAGATVVHNASYATGEMLSSLQVAVRHLPASCNAVLVMLADQPLVTPETMNQLIDAYAQSEATLVAPTYDGRRGNPVIIARAHFDELLTLPQGAAPRHLLRRHPDRLLLVPVDEPGVLLDIDHPTDYEKHRPRQND